MPGSKKQFASLHAVVQRRLAASQRRVASPSPKCKWVSCMQAALPTLQQPRGHRMGAASLGGNQVLYLVSARPPGEIKCPRARYLKYSTKFPVLYDVGWHRHADDRRVGKVAIRRDQTLSWMSMLSETPTQVSGATRPMYRQRGWRECENSLHDERRRIRTMLKCARKKPKKLIAWNPSSNDGREKGSVRAKSCCRAKEDTFHPKNSSYR